MTIVVNPNSDPVMSAALARTVARLQPDATARVMTNIRAPLCLRTNADARVAAASLPRLLAGTDPYVPVVIACQSDPGLTELRAVRQGLVIGMGAASLETAAGLTNDADATIGLVVATEASEPALRPHTEAVLAGRARLEVAAAAVEIPDLVRDPAAAQRGLRTAVRALLDRGCGAVVLGCAGMVEHRDAVQEISGDVPVLDGLTSAWELLSPPAS